MTYDWILEKRDTAKIDKLNKLTNSYTFWDDVKKLTSHVTSDHSINRWQALAEMRYNELFFEPRKRTCYDGTTWWCVWDIKANRWSTLTVHGRYKTRFECIYAIYTTP